MAQLVYIQRFTKLNFDNFFFIEPKPSTYIKLCKTGKKGSNTQMYLDLKIKKFSNDISLVEKYHNLLVTERESICT